jgi:hypothetical protein
VASISLFFIRGTEDLKKKLFVFKNASSSVFADGNKVGKSSENEEL